MTYIRLGAGFCYLAVLLDLFSRRIRVPSGRWHLSDNLEAKGALAALARGLTARKPAPGWIHHSDRGVQYACRD